MKLISAIACSAAAVGIYLGLTGNASASDVHCNSDKGQDVTVIVGHTACRTEVGDSGYARAAGYDGVGYAKASAGAIAVGFGAAGGVGASEGAAGVPISIGLGPDAFAYTSLAPGSGRGRIGVTIAMNGSRAQVISADHTVACLGAAALAWDSYDGTGCLATPLGRWQTGTPAG